VLAPPASAVSDAKAIEATIDAPIGNGETIAANPLPPTELRTKGGNDETR
jgi:hypothetical protein